MIKIKILEKNLISKVRIELYNHIIVKILEKVQNLLLINIQGY